MRFLKRFLDKTLYEFEVPGLPDRNAYRSLQEWNSACLEQFEDLDKRMSKIIKRFEAILDGREAKDDTLSTAAPVIKGPWH